MGKALSNEAITEIPLKNYSFYLQTRGWQEVDTDETGSYWNKLGSDLAAQTWLPNNPAVRTFAVRIAQLLEDVAETEDRSTVDVLRDITDLQRDAQEIRTFPFSKSGAISLNHSSESVQGLRKWVESAAITVGLKEDATVLPSKKPAAAIALLRETEMLTPAPGSFIWRISVPLSDHETSGQFPFELEDSGVLEDYARQTSLRLYDSTKLVSEAAGEALTHNSGLEPFRARVAGGLTADLCEALVQISAANATPLDFTFRWSRYRPTDGTKSKLALSQQQLEVIDWAGKELRREALEPDFTVSGFVVRLTRNGPSIMPGKITISGSDANDPLAPIAHYWVELSADDYQQAQRAHSQYLEVAVTGDLRRSPRRREILNPINFQVLSGPVDED